MAEIAVGIGRDAGGRMGAGPEWYLGLYVMCAGFSQFGISLPTLFLGLYNITEEMWELRVPKPPSSNVPASERHSHKIWKLKGRKNYDLLELVLAGVFSEVKPTEFLRSI